MSTTEIISKIEALREWESLIANAQEEAEAIRDCIKAEMEKQDIEELEHRLDKLLLLGSKGTTGTQASFVELFGGDSEKIKALEKMIAEEMGFDSCFPVSGQTSALISCPASP